jgi:hypothetical protein
MSFWDLSDGKNAAENTSTEYELAGGDMAPIPNGSTVLAIIDEAKWQETRDGDAEFVSLRWSVMLPEVYKNRKIFPKLWVKDLDPNAKDQDKAKIKRDKAKLMLRAIDNNCGGKLAKKASIPTDDDLTLALTNRQMVIKVMVWEMKGSDGQENSGNWISKVADRTAEIHVPQSAVKPKAKSPAASDDLDDDIPFD